MTRAHVLALAGALCLLPLRANADASKAWAAAKVNLPAETHVLVGMDLAAVTSSSLFSMMFPMLLSQQPDVKTGLELVKTTCKIDPMKAIDGFVVGTGKDSDEGAVFLALSGVDEAKLVSCLEAIAKSKKVPDSKIAVTRERGITQLSTGSGDKVYVKWFGKNVVALPLDVDNKAQLQKWAGTKNGLGKALVGKATAKVNTRATVWAISGVDDTIEGVKTRLGYGSLDARNGSLTADLRIVTGSAKDAKKVAAKAQEQLTAAAGAGDPELASILDAVSVSAAGPELVIKASLPEQSVMSLLGTLLK